MKQLYLISFVLWLVLMAGVLIGCFVLGPMEAEAATVRPEWQPPKFSYGDLVIVTDWDGRLEHIGYVRTTEWQDGFVGDWFTGNEGYVYGVEIRGQRFVYPMEKRLVKAKWVGDGRVRW